MRLTTMLFVLGMGSVMGSSFAAQAQELSLSWKELAPMPANAEPISDAIPIKERYWRQIGLAGPIVGVHKDHLLVGGGANFLEPGKMPNEGPALGKVYWDELFVMRLNENRWLEKRFKLPKALAYAATVSLPEGVLVIGGEGFARPSGAAKEKLAKFDDVFLMSWDGASETVTFKSYPALPAADSYTSAAVVGRTVFLQAGKAFLSLDLDNPAKGWTALPSWPGEARETAISAAVGGKVIVATGRVQKDGRWLIHKDAYSFDPKTNAWTTLPDMPFPAMAGEGFSVADRYLLVVGGDKDVARWNLIIGLVEERARALKNSPEWERLNAALTFIPDHHTGFNAEILAFDTQMNRWSEAGFFPGASPVTTQPVTWNGKLLLVSGEVRPGIRSPKVWMGSVKP